MAQARLQLDVIAQIAVPVADLERAVTFYRDTLGIKYLFQVPNLAFFDCAGVRLTLDIPQDGSAAGGSSVIYFKVDDINGAYETLSSLQTVTKRGR
jgi:catechol 2,3-dioxygenase-like lactoylglutathione lyase family enzyme